MSEQAVRQITKRQKFAAPGGLRDRLVRFLRVGLPSVIGVVLALLLFSPFSNTREMSFVLAKDEVNKAKERMKTTGALYRGEDSKGRPFSLRADSAIQKNSADPLVRMSGLSGQLLMEDGPARVLAPVAAFNMDDDTLRSVGSLSIESGRGYAVSANDVLYDMNAATVRSVGPLSFNDGNGFTVSSSNVLMWLKDKRLESFGAVNGSTRIGTFSAGKLRADLNSRIVRLEGGAHLRIDQSAIR
jgi:lipopolysaccharide export system protein LptC